MTAKSHHARRLGVFSATMIVVGGIIGAGIFLSPADVARRVGQPSLVLAAWVLGGVIALFVAAIGGGLIALGVPAYRWLGNRGEEPPPA
jgi:APA family basic amino acid/polyamine antiporter